MNEGDTGGSFLWLSLVSTEADFFGVRHSYSPVAAGAPRRRHATGGGGGWGAAVPAAAKVSPIFYLDLSEGMLDERSGVASHTVHRGRQRVSKFQLLLLFY